MARLWNETAIRDAAAGFGKEGVPALLRHVQGSVGYVSTDAVDLLAHCLRLPSSQLLREARSTPGLRSAPLMRRTVYVCDGQDCGLTRCRKLAARAVVRLGIDFNERTPDDALQLKLLRCHGYPHAACEVMVDDQVIELASVETFDEIVSSLAAGR